MYFSRSLLPRSADVFFFVLAAICTLAALRGIWSISAGGAAMDSDLSCYAQNMAGDRHREMFRADPLLHDKTPANSLQNLETAMAELLTPGDNYAQGLFLAGALCLFVHYMSFYILGRFLFGAPSIACLLSLLMGIAVWFNFGTFWGAGFSDPTPRVFFAAIWPSLLAGALYALDRPRWRPPAMLACGACIYVHAISALDFGCMLFTAFLLRRADGMRRGAHLANLALSLALFFIPVLFFLWPSLGQERAFTPEELTLFQEVFALRFREDHGDLLARLVSHIRFDSDTLPLFCGGIAGFAVTVRRGGEKAKKLASMYPGFLLGMAFFVLFSWLEPKIAPLWGRLPMGQEFVRGVRFLAPLSWLMILSAATCLWPRLHCGLRRLIVPAIVAGILLASQDRWQMAACYAFSQYTGFPTPLLEQARKKRERAESYRQALYALADLAPPGSTVFGTSDNMAVRYQALRPLVYAFKDGSSYLYNKDAHGARFWLRTADLVEQGTHGYIEAWKLSDADWLLSDRPADKALIELWGEIAWENQDWLVARRR